MEKTIEMHCQSLIDGFFSFTTLDLCGFTITGFITHLVLSSLERRHLFFPRSFLLRTFLLRILLPYFLEKLCAKYIYHILSYIYIFTCKHLLSFYPSDGSKSIVTTTIPLLRSILNRCFRIVDRISPKQLLYLFFFPSFTLTSFLISREPIMSAVISFFTTFLISRKTIVYAVSFLATFLICRVSFVPSDNSNLTIKAIAKSFPILCLLIHMCYTVLVTFCPKQLLYLCYFLVSESGCNSDRAKEALDHEPPVRKEARKEAQINVKDAKMYRDELTLAMKIIGQSPTVEREQSIKHCMGYQEFSALFQESEPTLDEVKGAFSVFDQNRDGLVDAGDLERVLDSLGLRTDMNLDACERMIAQHDRNGDGYVDLIDFSRLLEMCLLEKVD